MLLLMSCQAKVLPLEKALNAPIQIEVNPYERVPLAALLEFTTQKPMKVMYTIDGISPISKTFDSYKRVHTVPVTGLHAGRENVVHLKLSDEKGKTFEGEVSIKTEPLPNFFPRIEVTRLNRDKMEPGLHLVEFLLANNGLFHSYTIMFDDQGEVRWFMDMSEAGQICYSALRLRNGNWFYLSWINLFELDQIGQLIRKDQMWGHAADHDVKELDNGYLLVGGTKKDARVLRDGQWITTRFDHAVVWDRASVGQAVKEWDLAEVLDIDRSVFPADYSLDYKADWFHINSIEILPNENGIIASGRNQGVIKVDNDNNPIWILAPHKGWGRMGRSGRGLHCSDYLLTAIDSTGKAYPKAVQEGTASTSDFSWPTGQHAVQLLKNGNILLFDNGLSRDFAGKPTYSCAVEFNIDESKQTIQQVWQYGKSRGLDMYSGITSDIDVLPETNNRLVTAGNIRSSEQPPHAKIVEITYPGNEEVFEANIYFKDLRGSKEKSWAQFDLVYRGERYSL